MGFSFKKAVKSIASVAVPAAIGYATGGPAGAAAASLGGNSMLSGAVGLGTDMLQSQYNLSQQKELAKYNAEQQMAINNQVYQQNLAMWNAENEYNSPAAQMARYKAAGLNPNLIYGQSNTAGSAPQLQAAHFDAGSYHPVDKSSQRQQAAIALMEFNQRIKSQALDNELKREQLLLQAQASERQDKLANAQIYALMQNAGVNVERLIVDRDVRRDTLAWRKYQDDLELYEKRLRNLPTFMSQNVWDPVQREKYLGRRPMYMDYL